MKKEIVVATKVDSELADKMREICERHEIFISQLIRKSLKKYVEEYDAEN